MGEVTVRAGKGVEACSFGWVGGGGLLLNQGVLGGKL